MSCGVGRRHGLDLALLWLWYRPAAVAPMRPLAWEPPYAVAAALKKKKDQKRKKKNPSILLTSDQSFKGRGLNLGSFILYTTRTR